MSHGYYSSSNEDSILLSSTTGATSRLGIRSVAEVRVLLTGGVRYNTHSDPPPSRSTSYAFCTPVSVYRRHTFNERALLSYDDATSVTLQ